jgi:hypothetical protein
VPRLTFFSLVSYDSQDQWLYHMTVVSGAVNSAGTQFEQLVQKLMDVDGDLSKYWFFFSILVLFLYFCSIKTMFWGVVIRVF